LEADVAIGVDIADLAARFGFDADTSGSGPLERDTPEDRGQGAARQATERHSAGRLRGNQSFR